MTDPITDRAIQIALHNVEAVEAATDNLEQMQKMMGQMVDASRRLTDATRAELAALRLAITDTKGPMQ